MTIGPRTYSPQPTAYSLPASVCLAAAPDSVSLSQPGAFSQGIQVDPEAGVIRNAAVLTIGPAIGHGFQVDATMLEQARASIASRSRGVKCRLGHPEVQGGPLGPTTDAAEVMLGRVDNPRIEGPALRGDVKLAAYSAKSPKGDMRSYFLGIAQEDPEVVGLSVVFKPAPYEPGANGDLPFGRIERVQSVDFVGDPGANPMGLLSQGGIEMNEALRKYLESVGLSAGATVEQAVTFWAGLKGRRAATAAALAEGGDAAAPAAPAAGGSEIPDVTPEEGETEEAFKARFMSDATMTEKYPDETSREARATDVWAQSQKPADDVAAPPAGNAGVFLPDPVSGAMSARQPAGQAAAALAAPAADQAVALERKRRADIVALGAERHLDADWTREMADTGMPVSQFLALSKFAETMTAPHIAVGMDRNLDTLAQGVEDAIALRAGLTVETPSPRSADFRHLRMVPMGREYLAALGVTSKTLGETEVVRLLFSRTALSRKLGTVGLAMSTGDFPFILANVLNKSLRQSYELATTTWQSWAKETTSPDFKQVSRVILSSAPDLESIPEGGEYKYGSLTEGREVYTLVKYGKALKFTRESMINDDLSAFNTILPAMGRKAKYLEDVTAYGVLTANAAMSDGVALFNLANHANTGTGAISVTSLGAGFAAMGIQTDLDGSTIIENSPKTLIVPKSLEIAADQFIKSTFDPATGVNPQTPNPFSGRIEVVPTPHLDATSTAVWYLAADPNVVDTVDVCFLEEERQPVLEEDEDFDTDARKYKVRHQIVAKAIDWRSLYRSSGIDL